MTRLTRIALALVASGALVAWGAVQLRASRERAAWRRAAETGGPVATLAVGPPPDARSMVRMARFHASDRLPPDYALAETLLDAALRRAPLRSDVWLELARLRLVQGDDAGARAALEQADALDPGWPTQRLASSRLWSLLGDEARSLRLAESVAVWDDEGLLEAAASLRLSGYPPADVWKRLGAIRTPQDANFVALLERLRSPDAQAMTDLWRALPHGPLSADPVVRANAATLFSDPLVPEALEALWRARGGRALEPLLEDPLVLAQNPHLLNQPIGDSFPLGWARLPDDVWVWSTWSPPEENPDHGVLDIRVASQSTVAQDRSRWQIYGLLLPPSEAAIDLQALVRARPRGRSLVSLHAVANGTNVAGTTADWGSEDWQTVSVRLSSSQEYRLVKLVLMRQQRGAADSQSVSVAIGGIGARLAEGDTP